MSRWLREAGVEDEAEEGGREEAGGEEEEEGGEEKERTAGVEIMERAGGEEEKVEGAGDGGRLWIKRQTSRTNTKDNLHMFVEWNMVIISRRALIDPTLCQTSTKKFDKCVSRDFSILVAPNL